jgi:hypothetical protein
LKSLADAAVNLPRQIGKSPDVWNLTVKRRIEIQKVIRRDKANSLP